MLTFLVIGIAAPFLISLASTGIGIARTMGEHRKNQKKNTDTSSEQVIHIEYVKKMNKAKQAMTEIYFYSKKIENRNVKQKAYRALMVAMQIYNNLEKHPEDIRFADRFIFYYLDVFLKLIKAQIELTAQNVSLDEIKKTLSDIEKGLAHLVVALKKQLAQMLSDDLMAIDTEITVLQKLEGKLEEQHQ